MPPRYGITVAPLGRAVAHDHSLGCSIPSSGRRSQRRSSQSQQQNSRVEALSRGRSSRFPAFVAALFTSLRTAAGRGPKNAGRRRLTSRGSGAAVLEAPPQSPLVKLRQNLGAVLRFVVPALGAAMLTPLLDTTDAIIVGRFGSVVDLAALSPSMCAADMLWLLFVFLAATTVNGLARARGRKDFAGARRMLSDSCCLAVCIGVLAGGLVITNLDTVVKLLISPAALAATAGPASAYITLRAFFFPVQLLQLVLAAACFSGLQDTMTPLKASVVGGFANLTVDLILIAGMGLGCLGAAAGTVAGQVSAVLILAHRLRRARSFEGGDETQKQEVRAALMQQPGQEKVEALPLLSSPVVWLGSLRRDRMMPLLAFAAPFLTFQLMKVGLFGIETRMGSAFGPISLAAHQIQYTQWRFLISLCDPIMQAAQALVPVHFAAGTDEGRQRARELGQAITVVSITMGLLSAALGLGMSHWLPPLFTTNGSVAAEAASLAIPSAISVAALSVWHCNEGLMLATGRAKLLAILYTWNTAYFAGGSYYILTSGKNLYDLWVLSGSMHFIFSVVVSIVLRLPRGLFHKPRKPVPKRLNA